MENMTAEEIAKAAGGEIICGRNDSTISSVAIDSRKVQSGGLFFALKGNRVDGHDYINDAFISGATVAVTDRDIPCNENTIIKTASSLRALQGVAAHYRSKFEIPIVAVTGSVGKTTTKEICYAVLSSKYKTLKSEGNLNSDIGMPLSVFGLSKSYEAAVFEMGMSSAGEIAVMTQIAKPYIGVISNIGVSHIEKLGSRENILKAKLEIEQGLLPDGLMIMNGDDALLWEQRDKLLHKTLYFGIENQKCDFLATNISFGASFSEFDIKSSFGVFHAKINVLGYHNVYNALAAISVGLSLGLSFEEVAEGLLFFRNAAMRQNIREENGIIIFEDCYNASPDSMKAALKVLGSLNANKKIAVLSDMLELGEHSKKMHFDVGKMVAQAADYLICYGNFAPYIIDGAKADGMNEEKCLLFANANECAEALSKIAEQGDAILFKGSRGMKVEDVLNLFTERCLK